MTAPTPEALAREHTTHYDDCGCLSAKYEAEVKTLRAELAALAPVVRAAVAYWLAVNGRPCADVSLSESVDALPADLRAKYAGDGATTPEGYEDEGFA